MLINCQIQWYTSESRLTLTPSQQPNWPFCRGQHVEVSGHSVTSFGHTVLLARNCKVIMHPIKRVLADILQKKKKKRIYKMKLAVFFVMTVPRFKTRRNKPLRVMTAPRAPFYKVFTTSDTHMLRTTNQQPIQPCQNKLMTVVFHEQAGWPVSGMTLASELPIVMIEFPWIYSHIQNELPAYTRIRLRLTPHTYGTHLYRNWSHVLKNTEMNTVVNCAQLPLFLIVL